MLLQQQRDRVLQYKTTKNNADTARECLRKEGAPSMSLFVRPYSWVKLLDFRGRLIAQDLQLGHLLQQLPSVERGSRVHSSEATSSTTIVLCSVNTVVEDSHQEELTDTSRYAEKSKIVRSRML